MYENLMRRGANRVVKEMVVPLSGDSELVRKSEKHGRGLWEERKALKKQMYR